MAVTSLSLLLSTDWRLNLLALTLQYVGVFLLVLQDWSFEMATTKLVAGWISAAIIGMAVNNLTEVVVQEDGMTHSLQNYGISKQVAASRAGRMVVFLSAILMGLVVTTFTPQVVSFFPGIGQYQAAAGFLLVGMGLLQLGFFSRPFAVIVGLLTILSGFEIIFAPVDDSALVAGLLASTNLAIALVGAYLLLAPTMQEED